MTIHHDKHHAAYVKNLNDALKDQPDFLKMDVVDVLKNVDKLPKEIQQKVINNGGGHLNHSLFWLWMAPKDKGGGGEPTGDLAKAIDAAFGDFGKFKDKMKAAAHRPLRQRLGLARPQGRQARRGQHRQPGQPAHHQRRDAARSAWTCGNTPTT